MMSLWSMSVSGGLLIISIALLRALLKNKLPKVIFYLFWFAAVVRLLVPYQLPSKASVYNLFSDPQVVVQREMPFDHSVLEEELPKENTAIADIINEMDWTPAIASSEPVKTQGSIYPLAYVFVAVSLGTYFFIKHRAWRREYSSGLPCDGEAIKLWQEANALRRPLEVRTSDKIKAPVTYGILRPVILLPKTFNFSDEAGLSFVLAHELVHIRRFDIIYKLLLLICCCIHWLNPLVWLMLIMAQKDIELSCDEAVVKAMGKSKKTDYARTLIHLEEDKAGLTPLYNAFGGNSTEERIEAVMKFRKISVAGVCAGAVVIALGVLLFATSPAVPPENTPLQAADIEEEGEVSQSRPSAAPENSGQAQPMWQYPFVSNIPSTQTYVGDAYYTTVNWNGRFEDTSKAPEELLLELPEEIQKHIDVENFAYKDGKFTGFTLDDKMWALEITGNESGRWAFKMQQEDITYISRALGYMETPTASVWGNININPFSMRQFNYGKDVSGRLLKVPGEGGAKEVHVKQDIEDYSGPLYMADLTLSEGDKIWFSVKNADDIEMEIALAYFNEDGTVDISESVTIKGGGAKVIKAPWTGIFSFSITVNNPALLDNNIVTMEYEKINK